MLSRHLIARCAHHGSRHLSSWRHLPEADPVVRALGALPADWSVHMRNLTSQIFPEVTPPNTQQDPEEEYTDFFATYQGKVVLFSSNMVIDEQFWIKHALTERLAPMHECTWGPLHAFDDDRSHV